MGTEMLISRETPKAEVRVMCDCGAHELRFVYTDDHLPWCLAECWALEGECYPLNDRLRDAFDIVVRGERIGRTWANLKPGALERLGRDLIALAKIIREDKERRDAASECV